jgi:prolipoprotein diacylglyceryltransferase
MSPSHDRRAPSAVGRMTVMVSRTALGGERTGDRLGVGKPTPDRKPAPSRGYTSATVPIAVIAFDFDPLIRIADGLTVRWQTIALATVVALCLTTAGVLARRSGLRPDDLLFIVIGAVPGAVVGGRIGYALLVPEAFAAGPLTLFDPAAGGLELGLAVLGGIATGWVVAVLLGAPPGAWAHLASIPLIAAIAVGKLTMALGGSGQGRPFDGSWATAYLGPGPWVDPAATLPSHPSQIYEGVGTVVVALLVLAATSLGAFRSRDGSRLLIGIAGWAIVRAIVSTTWRDPAVAGSLPAGGLIAVAIAVGGLAGASVVSVWWPRRARAREAAAQPVWPDPETRPPF